MSKITILTISPESSFLKRFYFLFKSYVKNHFFHYRGPEAVLRSLTQGFNILNVDYQLNPKTKKISDVVCVLSGVDALKWAIKSKKQNKIKRIIAGPNVVVTPEDVDGILLNKTIDLVIKPSQWGKDFCSSFDPGFNKRIRVWPAGVETCFESKQKRQGCLIYKKNVDENLFNFIIKYLKSQSVDYKIIKYGNYKKERYFEMLDKVKFMIYLSKSESQGLAIQEAWIRNVPTLVWNRGYWQYRQYKWQGSSSAPYLTNNCGMFFKSKNDFINKFEDFVKNFSNFKPREYSLKNFTDEITSGRYLEFIKEVSYFKKYKK